MTGRHCVGIRDLLEHPSIGAGQDKAVKIGRRAVQEEFNWGVEEKKFLALYEDILKE